MSDSSSLEAAKNNTAPSSWGCHETPQCAVLRPEPSWAAAMPSNGGRPHAWIVHPTSICGGLPFARHCPRSWGYSREQKSPTEGTGSNQASKGETPTKITCSVGDVRACGQVRWLGKAPEEEEGSFKLRHE